MILQENRAPDVYYRWTLNPYRGCRVACAFCIGRNTQKYLERDPGEGFDNDILVKDDAPTLLEQELRKKSWRGETITFSGVTDPYQPIEEQTRLTRACLEVCLRFRQPVRIVSKTTLVERDLDLFLALHREARFEIEIALAFDTPTAALLEPHAPTVEQRLQTIERLARAGLSVGVMAAPVLLGLNDAQLLSLLPKARTAGATRATWTVARIPSPMAHVFVERLRAALPHRADKVLALLRDARSPTSGTSEFHDRNEAVGAQARAVDAALHATCHRVGFQVRPYRKWTDPPTTFQREQLRLL